MSVCKRANGFVNSDGQGTMYRMPYYYILCRMVSGYENK
jgi:hypothetical protein